MMLTEFKKKKKKKSWGRKKLRTKDPGDMVSV